MHDQHQTEVCRVNIARCLEQILSGQQARADFEGALQGYADWCAELRLLLESK